MTRVIPPQPDSDLRTTSGAIGTKQTTTVTFHGRDPDTVASAALCASTPTSCQARTRLYRGGKLAAEGFPPQDISEHLASDESAYIWLDLRNPDHDDLAVLSQEFGLHPLAV